MMVLRFPLPLRQHIVERIMADGFAQPQHPIRLFIFAAGGHPVNRVLSLHHFALGVRLARFDEVRTAAGVQLEAVLLLAIARLPHGDVLQRNDAPGFFVRRVLEVVQAVVVEDEPATFPALVTTALLP